MAEIALDTVKKTYPGGVEAIQGISLDIADGEMIVLVGPSGCGKSTLLRMVAGLETVTSGEVRIAGRRVNDLEPADRDIAMVFQTYALYPHMTVYDNMAYGLRNRGTDKGEIDRRVRETAGILQLDHLLGRRPRQLSGGQRQRVAMGRASPPPFSSTSRFPISMPSCACRCAWRSAACSANWRRPASMSPTTSSRQ